MFVCSIGLFVVFDTGGHIATVHDWSRATAFLQFCQFRPPIALRTACRESDAWREKSSSAT